MNNPLVVVIMGSSKDELHAKKIIDALEEFGIESVLRIASAHKTVKHLVDIVSYYERCEREKVYITIAGRSNGLSGVVDGLTMFPTIACPPYSDSFAGYDILSSLRMPQGIAPAVVLEPRNAAFLAARILSLVDAGIKTKLECYMKEQKDAILKADEVICKDGN